MKTRFAPSPTGRLHLGNVRTALFNFLLAHQGGGEFLLRVEDTDAMRGHEKYTAMLETDLRWLGIAWDEGPAVGGEHGPYVQSQRDEIYKSHFAVLERQGLAYPCFCSEHELAVSRKTQLAAGKPPRYAGRCRGLNQAEVAERFAKRMPSTLRFHVADGQLVEFEDKVRGRQEFNTGDIGDFIIRRSDGTPAFFFCNAVDDALMGVTLVVRGEDHLTNSPRQILLLKALNLPVPDYAHIALVVGADGAPLSKRTGSRSVEELRTSGYLPQAINNYLARLGHTYDSNELLDLMALAKHFSIERLHKAPARYDEAQLLHWQREVVREAAPAELWSWMEAAVSDLISEDKQIDFVEAVRGNITFPQDALHWARIIFSDDVETSHNAHEAIRNTGGEFFAQALPALHAHSTDFKGFSAALKKVTGTSGKNLYQPLRAALTGELDGPEMARLLPLIGVERARERLAKYAK
jgi:nondiscriminating glutamyl-tRNA synthetase